jgi:hypothetical protein
VRDNTSIPAPKVHGFDDSNGNEIGYEWILMEVMDGALAKKRWWTMSSEQKLALTRRAAAFQVELLGRGAAFKTIGLLDPQRRAKRKTMRMCKPQERRKP